MTPKDQILHLGRQHGLTITVAESCTAGLLAAALTDLPGSSEVFEFGFVTYSNAAKHKLLAVPMDTFEKYGAVSQQVVHAMAVGALAAASADIAVAISGIAGPGGSEHKPEGRVCFGLATAQRCDTVTVEFGALGRSVVRTAATEYALGMILRHLKSAY